MLKKTLTILFATFAFPAFAVSIGFDDIGYVDGPDAVYHEDGFYISQHDGFGIGNFGGADAYRLDVDDDRFPSGFTMTGPGSFSMTSLEMSFGSPYFTYPVSENFMTFEGYRNGSLVALATTGAHDSGYVQGEAFTYDFGDVFSDIDQFVLRTTATDEMLFLPDEFGIGLFSIDVDPGIAPVPLPASLPMLGLGLIGLFGWRRLRRA